MQEEFDKQLPVFDEVKGNDVTRINYQIFNEKYAALVQKYNDLVDQCASIPSPPKPMYCTTTNLGHGDGTIFCY